MGEHAATVTSVSSSASTVTLFAALTGADNQYNAVGRMIYNASTAVLYVKFGASASSTDYTVQLASNAYYELPHPVYDGLVTGVWASANGAALCTEVRV